MGVVVTVQSGPLVHSFVDDIWDLGEEQERFAASFLLLF